MTRVRPLEVVLDMQDRRPAWAMPAWVPDRIREALPAGSSLVVMTVPADGSGDGSARVDPVVLAAVENAEAYFGYGVPAELVQRGARLRWIHSGSAGVASSLTPPLLGSGIVFTNSAGVHAEPMAETVLGMVLHFFRGFHHAAESARRGVGRWDTTPFYVADHGLRELSRSTVGVVGFGGVGRAVGARCAALGARVLGLRRTDVGPGGAQVELRLPNGATARAEVLSGASGWGTVLAESDAIVLTVPDTQATRGMVDAEALRRMKSSAVLVNVGRGRLVDGEALLEALRTGRIRGAALDVFDREPLPDDDPLWSLPNVLITPHVSAVSDAYWEREAALIVDNIGRFSAGEPLRNVVDPERGY